MKNLDLELYKTTYEGSYGGLCFELEIFRDENWQIIWLEEQPDGNIKEIEDEIYAMFGNDISLK